MTLSLDTAYRSFGGEVEASSTPTICRLPDSRRHQLWAIALADVEAAQSERHGRRGAGCQNRVRPGIALAGWSTPKEDQWFFRERVFKTCEVWGAYEDTAMAGMIAFRSDWIDHLYVLPKTSRARRRHRTATTSPALVRSPAALDLPAQPAGS